MILSRLPSTWRRRLARRYRVWHLVAVFVIAIIVYIVPTGSPLDRHLARLDYLRKGPFLQPRNAREWFSLSGARFVHWNFTQRISNQPASYNDWADALEKERQTLVQLGYYNMAWVRLPIGCDLGNPKLQATAVGKIPFSTHGDNRRPTEIRVTAKPEQIREFAAAVATIPNAPKAP